MAKQLVNVGTSVNKGDGDPLRTAFQKINDNFNELYASTSLDLDSIGSNMIPTSDGGFALGSATKQWSDLYVRDFIYIGGTRLQSDAQGNITVDGGSLQIKDVQGDIFADDSTKVFDSSTQTFTGKFEGELIGSVAADDSTVLIDGVAGTINAGALTGALPAIDGSALTGISASSVAFSNVTGTPTTISGYGITDAYTKTEVDNAITSSVLPSGSAQSIDVVAQDSTVLVDSVNGTLNATTLTGALPAIDGSALTGVVTAGSDFEGNLSGSVFADDSTILIDGTTGQIVGPVTTSTLTLNSENITLGNGSTAGTEAVSIGKGTNAGNYAVAIGNNAGNTTQDQGAVAIGSEAGETNQGPRAIAIGNYAGETDQDYNAVAIGYEAGETTQGGKAIAIGWTAGQTNQAQGNVAIGSGAGNTDQGSVAVAIGEFAGGINQSASAVAIGQNAGSTGQGEWSVAIGRSAGKVNQADNSIVINASGGDLNNTTPNSFVVKPIRNAQGVTTLMYNETTGEVTHSTSADLLSGSSQSIDIVAADSTLLVDSSNGTLNSSALTKPIKLNDEEKAIFGTGDDLQIWHTPGAGGASIIQNATGQLQVRGDTVRFLNAATTEDFAYFNNNGSVDLYYDGTKKFATSAGGIQIEQGVEEKFATLTGSTGVVAHDCDNGHVFYHTGASGDITANFTNLGLTAEYGTNLTVIINQGATPYEVTAVQIGGAAQTINWQGGSAPTGNANGIDSFSFTILNDGGSYVVLGQMVDFT